MKNEVFFQEVFSKVRNRQVAIWAGAGFSRCAQLPDARSLVKELMIKYDFDLPDNTPLLNIAERIVYREGDIESNKSELLYFLKRMLITAKIGSSHHNLSCIPYIDTIVTTNYDNLFENAYNTRGCPIYNNKTYTMHESTPDKVKIYKIHGDFADPGSIVLTTSEYSDLIGNISTNLVMARIRDFFATKTIVFIGYSMEDLDVTSLLEFINKICEKNNHQHYLISPNVALYVQNRLSQLGITYINSTGEEFTEYLLQKTKNTMIPDFNNHALVDPHFRSSLLASGYHPKFTADGNNYIVSGLSSDKGDICNKLTVNFKGTKAVIDSFKKVYNGDFVKPVTIPDGYVYNLSSEAAGYNLFSSDNVSKMTFFPLPKYVGTAEMYYSTALIPRLVNVEYYESKSEVRLLVKNNHLTASAHVIFNPKTHYSFTLNFINDKPSVSYLAAIYKEREEFMDQRNIRVKIPGRESPFFIVYEGIIWNQKYETFYKECKSTAKLFANLLLIEAKYSIKFDLNKYQKISENDYSNAQSISWYLENNLEVRFGKLFIPTECKSDFGDSVCFESAYYIDVSPQYLPTIDLLGHRFLCKSIHIKPCCIKRMKRTEVIDGVECYIYKAKNGLIPCSAEIAHLQNSDIENTGLDTCDA